MIISFFTIEGITKVAPKEYHTPDLPKQFFAKVYY
jgi:hypothetical protein